MVKVYFIIGNQIGNTTTLNGNANVVSFLPYGSGNTYLLLDNQSQFFQFNADTAQFSGTGCKSIS